MSEESQNLGQVLIYQDGDMPVLEVKLEQDTVWLSQSQMVDLFGSSKANVSEHIKNIFDEGELDVSSTVRKFRTVQTEGNRKVEREIEYYNLDMIISLGYRIRSKIATSFRIWATSVLRDYTLKGIAINQKRLDQLNLALDIVSRSDIAEVAGVGDVIKRYVGALHLLEEFDKNTLSEPKGKKSEWQIDYTDAREFLDTLKNDAGFNANFASERNEQFKGIVAGLYQTFGGNELYVSVEEKAANLLYQVVKDHPFVDGNKRSGAALFVYFLARCAVKHDINSNSLAAITLMTALSKPTEKDQIILLIRNFLASSK